MSRNLEELMDNMREVIELCNEDELFIQNEYIGVQKVSIEHEPASAQG